ncbi:MAG: hypothetical protein WA399_08340 [Acidobacteriaceae bacterium]
MTKPKPEYASGEDAQKRFEHTMQALFRVPKDTAKKSENPAPKPKKKGKD